MNDSWKPELALVLLWVGLLLLPVLLPLAGIVSIWALVKWINRRDDPRHDKRPSESA